MKRREPEEIVFASGRGDVTNVTERRLHLTGPGTLRDASRLVSGHGVQLVAWNGGWVMYCTCGFSPPRMKCYSDGMEQLERHWWRRSA